MAVRVSKWIQPQAFPSKLFQAQLFADAKEDVTADMTIIGKPDGGMAPGSSVMTAKGEVAFLKSDGTWSWV